MTCVIIQWVFNLRPILVIGKRHHLAFIKVEGDAFSLFAWAGSGRETRGVLTPRHTAPLQAGRAKGLPELHGFDTDPPRQGYLTQRGAGRLKAERSPGTMLPCQRWGQRRGHAGSCLSFPHSSPGVGSSVFCRTPGLSALPTVSI